MQHPSIHLLLCGAWPTQGMYSNWPVIGVTLKTQTEAKTAETKLFGMLSEFSCPPSGTNSAPHWASSKWVFPPSTTMGARLRLFPSRDDYFLFLNRRVPWVGPRRPSGNQEGTYFGRGFGHSIGPNASRTVQRQQSVKWSLVILFCMERFCRPVLC